MRDVVVDVPSDRAYLRCFGGGRLADGNPLRYVYLDEAGTSAREQIAIVAGVVIHAETEWRPLNDYLEFLRQRYVPSHLRDGYVFHATDLFSGGKNRADFPDAYRWRILDRLVSAPRKFRLGVVFGYRRKEEAWPDGPIAEASMRHAFAFAVCLSSANDYIKARFPKELATVWAEDCTHIRKKLKAVPKMIREHPEIFRRHAFDAITDSVNFAIKAEAPLLQIADACAFAIRRYAATGGKDDRLVRSMTGGSGDLSFAGRGGHGLITSQNGFAVQPHPFDRWE
jgi:hypothetical protein